MLLLTTVAALASLQGAGGSGDFRWTGALARGKTLEVLGVNGEVRATAASGSSATVTATKRGRKSDPGSVQIKVEETAGGVTICAIYPSQEGNGCHGGKSRRGRRHDENDVNVNFIVHVPAGVKFVGRTVNGDIEATDLDADARVSTVNGDAEVSTRGWAVASTVNGDVTASVGRADWTGPAEFQTVNGSVTITLPASVNADVRASTVNGDIETDFPLTVTGRFNTRRIRGTIGDGSRELSLATVNGDIRLLSSRTRSSR